MWGMGTAGALLERDAQVLALDAAWVEVQRSGRGQVVLVRGEAGSGKTALLRRFTEQVTGPVAWGSCHPLSTPRPLGPFAEVADQVGGTFAEVVAGEGKPHEIARALSRFLPGDGPTVVVLEDLHWADEASLDVLRLLARPLRDRAVLVVATYRDDEIDRCSSLQTALGDLRGPETSRLEVPALSVTAVTELARGTGRDASDLHRLTGGNAFFLTEVLAGGGDLPATVRDAALARLARLGPQARAVAESVAVVPQRCELWLVEALAGLAHLDEAVAGGVLVAHEDGVSFRHELARRAVEGTLPPYRRLLLHRAALAALLDRPAPDSARLAHHAELAQDPAAVLLHAPVAAERAARVGAKREAVAHWEQALRHCPESDRERRADLLEEYAAAVFLLDGMAQSIAALEESLQIRRETGDRVGEGRVLNGLVRRLGCAGREDEGPAALAAAHEVLESLPPTGELARTFALHAYTCLELGDLEGVREWGWLAVELAEEHGATDVVVHALNTMGIADLHGGRDPDLVLRSLALAREHDLDEAVGRAWLNLGGVYAAHRRVDQLGFLEQGLADCERRGLELWRRYVAVSRAELQLTLGRWDDAVDGIADLLALPVGDGLLRVLAWCVTATARLRRGDPGVREALDLATTLADGHVAPEWSLPVALLAAELAWVEGVDAGQVRALTDEVLQACREVGDDWGVDGLLRWRRLAGVTDEPTTGRTALSTPNVEHWRAVGCGYDAALSLLELGEPVEALALLQLIGARGTAARVAKDLRTAGVRELPRGPRTSTLANPALLTEREVEVLGLVAEGLSNPMIAERLVLSSKTVDKHVSALLRKLGVSSRRDAAARAQDLGLLAPAVPVA